MGKSVLIERKARAKAPRKWKRMLGTCRSSKETCVLGADGQLEWSNTGSHGDDGSLSHKVLLCHCKSFGFLVKTILSKMGCHCKIQSRGMT